MADKDSIVEKLQKLLAHQRSAQDIGNLAEAEAFAGKLQELLTKHKLEMSEIEFEQREESEPVDREHVTAWDIGIKPTNRRVEWQEDLASTVAHCNGCELLVARRSNTVFFVGRSSDRQACVSLYGHFVRMAFNLAAKEAEAKKDEQRVKCQREHGQWYNGAHLVHWMKAFRHSFCVGFGDAIERRLNERRRELEKAHKAQQGESSTAMIHIRKDAEAVTKFIEGLNLKSWRGKDHIQDSWNNLNPDGYRSGKAAGETAALTSHVLAG